MLMTNAFTNNIFDDFFGNGGFLSEADKTIDKAFGRPFGSMKTDIKETDEGYVLSIDLPGYELENIKGEVKDGYLTVTAESTKETNEENKKKGYIHKERFMGSCSRSFYVGEAVTQADIKAKFKNGVLTIDVPKKEKEELPEERFIMIEG